MKKSGYVIGVDEAGRGPLAGPVTAAAVLMPINFKLKTDNPGTGIRDSKKYSENQRDQWFSYIEKDNRLSFEFSSVWPRRIEKINIFEAASLAATRSVKRLVERRGLEFDDLKIILDGSLKLKIRDIDYKVIIRGDETEDSIKMASIVAKVKRDSSMKRIHRKYNKYKFKKNKGYGTQEHRDALKEYGPCQYHRRTFIKNC